MVISRNVLLVFLCSLIFCLKAQAQQYPIVNSGHPNEEAFNRELRDREMTNRRKAMDDLINRRRGVALRRLPENKPLTREEIAKIKAALAPNAEDAEQYKNFLRQKNTGLFRLFPNFDCEAKNLVRVSGKCADFVSGSWNYSFRQKNYAFENFFDIKFENGKLATTGFLSQGIFVRLGAVALENVAPATDGIKFLLSFAPETRIDEAKKQFTEILQGTEAASGLKYTKIIKPELDTTYALRVVAYRSQVKGRGLPEKMTAEESKYYYLNDSDKRIDLTIAFRIIRRDENGSLTILWKEINRQDAPKIVFAKNESLSDINPDK